MAKSLRKSIMDEAVSSEEKVIHGNDIAASLGADQVAEERPHQEYYVFRLKKNNRHRPVHIDGMSTLWNPEKNRMEQARLVTGLPTIWMAEQKDVSDDYIRKNTRSLTFNDRTLRLHYTDTTGLLYARLHGNCTDNQRVNIAAKHPFFEWNPYKQAEELERQKEIKLEAMEKAFTATEEEVRRHASFLGIKFTDEVDLPKVPKRLKNDYVTFAEADPKKFLESYGSALVNLSYAIRTAINHNKIDIAKDPNKIFWSNGGFICAVPQKKNALETLVEFAASKTKEAEEFKDQLSRV